MGSNHPRANPIRKDRVYVTLAVSLEKALTWSLKCRLHWRMKTWSLLASEPSNVSGSLSLVGGAADTKGVLWAARVFAHRHMRAARLPPMALGSGLVAEVALVAADGLLTARTMGFAGGAAVLPPI